jgi:hypothetical protein
MSSIYDLRWPLQILLMLPGKKRAACNVAGSSLDFNEGG